MSPVFTETFNGALVELIEIVRTIATYQAAIAAVEIEIVAMWIEGSIFLVSTAVQTPGVCVIAVEATAQELCNAGDIELGNKDFVDRECTCDGVAEVGDFDTFEEYGGTQQPDAETPAQEDAAQPAETLDSLNGPWRNDACLGYAAVAMERADLDEETIRKVMHTLESCFDIISVREAGDYYARKATVCGW